MAEEKNIALTVDLTDGVTLLADNIKLSQAVSNLVDNAIKFTDQVDASRSGQKGTDLGLQICKRIIEAHNGRIKVEQNRDKGTTFIVWLPVNE